MCDWHEKGENRLARQYCGSGWKSWTRDEDDDEVQRKVCMGGGVSLSTRPGT